MSKPRTIVITGATRGLGLAMSKRFVSLGHVVIGCGRSKQAVDTVMSEIGKLHRFDTVDVTSDSEVAIWAKNILKDFGSPDILINNAALINSAGPLWQISANEFDAVVDANIKGVGNVIRHFVPAMVLESSGIIVNFSSGWGRGTEAGFAPYCATKWAIEGLTRSLAQELPNGMAAIPLDPGVIDTDMLKSCYGPKAVNYPSPDSWAEIAVPFLLKLDTIDNGKPLTVPQLPR